MVDNQEINDAMEHLNKIMRKSRHLWYKPIQIAEVLYRDRVVHDVDWENFDTCRKQSKQWRDCVTKLLSGRVSTSSSKYQDDVFTENAMPPSSLSVLANENRITEGAVEAYIYRGFAKRLKQLKRAFEYCCQSTNETFDLVRFIGMFEQTPGLRRSLDKIYEIVAYSLFSSLVEALQARVEVSIDSSRVGILRDFHDFGEQVMSLKLTHRTFSQSAKVFRVGVTNAADRGLDMYSNWGAAIQVKHMSLNDVVARDILESVSSDRVVIVCKSADLETIESRLDDKSWEGRVQGIVTEDDLVAWYEKSLRGKYANIVGVKILDHLRTELEKEFPSVGRFEEFFQGRGYDRLEGHYWME